MAGKKKTGKTKSAASSSASNVTRVRATDTKPEVKKSTKAKAKAVKPVAKIVTAKTTPAVEIPAKKRRSIKPAVALKPVKATGGYFKGAWDELKQVRWPTRRATWSLTGAVLLYTAFFIVLVLLLDAAFKYIFELILGK